jgi:hypothetical protein
MTITTVSTVATLPGLIMCPSCSSALFKLDYMAAHEPPPEHLRMKCLNTRCPELGKVKLVPVKLVEVEVCDAPDPDAD